MLSQKKVTVQKLLNYVNKILIEIEHENDLIRNKIDESKMELEKEIKNTIDLSNQIKKIMDPFLKDIFTMNFKNKYKKKNQQEFNLTLIESILQLLLADSFGKDEDDDKKYSLIMKLREKLVLYISNEKNFRNYQIYNWNKKESIDSIVQFKNNKYLIKIIADYFNINIFILNLNEDKIFVMTEPDYYDIFRENIVLCYNYGLFEPLFYKNEGIFNYKNDLIKKLVNVEKNYLNIFKINFSSNEAETINFNIKLKKLINAEDINEKNNNMDIQSETIIAQPDIKIETSEKKIIQPETENEYQEIYPNESDANIFVDELEKNSIKIDIKISNRMKLDEIKEIAKKYQIDIEKKLPNNKIKIKNKNELIEEIKKKIEI